jgi:hypothetical protein
MIEQKARREQCVRLLTAMVGEVFDGRRWATTPGEAQDGV